MGFSRRYGVIVAVVVMVFVAFSATGALSEDAGFSEHWYEIFNAKTGEDLRIGDTVHTGEKRDGECYSTGSIIGVSINANSSFAGVIFELSPDEDCVTTIQAIDAINTDRVAKAPDDLNLPQSQTSASSDEESETERRYAGVEGLQSNYKEGFECFGMFGCPDSRDAWTLTESTMYFSFECRGTECEDAKFEHHEYECNHERPGDWQNTRCSPQGWAINRPSECYHEATFLHQSDYDWVREDPAWHNLDHHLGNELFARPAACGPSDVGAWYTADCVFYHHGWEGQRGAACYTFEANCSDGWCTADEPKCHSGPCSYNPRGPEVEYS